MVRSQPLERWVAAVECGLAIVMAYLCAQLAWSFLAPKPWQDANAASGVVRPLPAAVGTTEILTRFNPFFRQGANTLATNSVDANAPETMLAVKLFGIRAWGEPGKGSAIIGLPDDSQKSFQTGQEIMTGVVLERVMPDRVVLLRSGVRETLSLDKERAVAAGAPPAPAIETQPATTAEVPRQRLNTEAADFFAQVQLQPRVQGGAVNGFTVTPRGDATLLTEAGLQPGDVILAVNDTRLDGPQKMAALMRDFKPAERLSLEIERGGQVQTHRLMFGD